MKSLRQKVCIFRRKGSTLIVVLILAFVLGTVAMFLGVHSSGQQRSTERAIGGDQAASLAEVGLNRAVKLIQTEILKGDVFNPQNGKKIEDGPASALFLPLGDATTEKNELSDEIGSDIALDIKSLKNKGDGNGIYKFSKSDLTKDEKVNKLDDLVKYAGFDKVEDWDLNVEMEIVSAYKVTSKTENGEEYFVPGVDIPYSLSNTSKKFLENVGIPVATFQFPNGCKLLDFTIPFTVHIPMLGDITLAKLDVVDVVDYAVRPLTKHTKLASAFDNTKGDGESSSKYYDKGVGVGDMVTVDKLSRALFGDKGALWKGLYPPQIGGGEKQVEGKPYFAPPSNNLWEIAEGSRQNNIEKYGTIKFTSTAAIKFKNGTTSTRRITATKDFKVADIMPMAPLYSVFVANTANDRINFNNYGGQMYVNNSASRLVKDKSKIEKNRDHSGLIRVNFDPSKDGGSDSPLVVNVSLIGSSDGPSYGEDGSFLDSVFNVAAGVEAPLMLGGMKGKPLSNMKYNTDFSVNCDTVKIEKDGKKVPGRVRLSANKFNKGFEFTNKVTDRLAHKTEYKENRKKFEEGGLYKYQNQQRDIKFWSNPDFKLGKWQEKSDAALSNKQAEWDQKRADYKKGNWFQKKILTNFIPDLNDLSSNVFGFGAAVGKRFAGSHLGLTLGSAAEDNGFLEFELPNMGTSNGTYCLPTIGWGQNKTHFFGGGAMSPTLTRDIEGAVSKQYRQWRTTIFGLLARDRLPILPFPPPWCNLPPFPIPYWWADKFVTKYDYDLSCLKACDGDAIDYSYHVYSPDSMENMPANWYSNEQFAKKSNYFYKDYRDFLEDVEKNRIREVDGKKVLPLNGVTYVCGSIGVADKGYKPKDADTLYVTGKGMIVCSGNAILDCNIKYFPENPKDESEQTVFSLICRNGGLAMVGDKDKNYVLQGSYYTNRGIHIGSNSKINIQGNWITNEFQRTRMHGDILIDYIAHFVRPSLGSLHPSWGKYDPKRYNLSLANKWGSWRVDNL